jgi:outer membrane receptor for ferrienterochelin and colicins
LNHFGAVSRVFSDEENSNLNIQEQDAYTMMDATIHKIWWNKRLKTTVGIRNILDVVNVNANATNVGAHTPSTSFISISPGRTYFMTIRYELFK